MLSLTRYLYFSLIVISSFSVALAGVTLQKLGSAGGSQESRIGDEIGRAGQLSIHLINGNETTLRVRSVDLDGERRLYRIGRKLGENGPEVIIHEFATAEEQDLFFTDRVSVVVGSDVRYHLVDVGEDGRELRSSNDLQILYTGNSQADTQVLRGFVRRLPDAERTNGSDLVVDADILLGDVDLQSGAAVVIQPNVVLGREPVPGSGTLSVTQDSSLIIRGAVFDRTGLRLFGDRPKSTVSIRDCQFIAFEEEGRPASFLSGNLITSEFVFQGNRFMTGTDAAAVPLSPQTRIPRQLLQVKLENREGTLDIRDNHCPGLSLLIEDMVPAAAVNLQLNLLSEFSFRGISSSDEAIEFVATDNQFVPNAGEDEAKLSLIPILLFGRVAILRNEGVDLGEASSFAIEVIETEADDKPVTERTIGNNRRVSRIRVSSSPAFSITDNEIEARGEPAVTFNVSSCRVENNTIINRAPVRDSLGIQGMRTRGAVVRGNRIEGFQFGLSLDSCAGTAVSENTFRNNTTSVRLMDSTTNSFVKNEFLGDTATVSYDGALADCNPIVNPDGRGVTIDPVCFNHFRGNFFQRTNRFAQEPAGENQGNVRSVSLAGGRAVDEGAEVRPLVVNQAGDESDADPNDGVADIDLEAEGLQTTLRAALEHIDSLPKDSETQVDFDLPVVEGQQPTIVLMNGLPTIEDQVFLNGASQPGTKRVVLDGTNLPLTTNGITTNGLTFGFGSDGSSVHSLSVVNCPNTGVVVFSNGFFIQNSFIGVAGERGSLTAAGNGQTGLDARFTKNLQIHACIISSNGRQGVRASSDGLLIQESIIGSDDFGSDTDLGNGREGIQIFNDSESTRISFIGGRGSEPAEENYIAFNGREGLEVEEGAKVILGANLLRNNLRADYDVGGDGRDPDGGGDFPVTPQVEKVENVGGDAYQATLSVATAPGTYQVIASFVPNGEETGNLRQGRTVAVSRELNIAEAQRTLSFGFRANAVAPDGFLTFNLINPQQGTTEPSQPFPVGNEGAGNPLTNLALFIEPTHDGTPLPAGLTSHYRVTVTNTSTVPASGVEGVLEGGPGDRIDAEQFVVSFEGDVITNITLTQDELGVGFSVPGSLAPGASISFVIQVNHDIIDVTRITGTVFEAEPGEFNLVDNDFVTDEIRFTEGTLRFGNGPRPAVVTTSAAVIVEEIETPEGIETAYEELGQRPEGVEKVISLSIKSADADQPLVETVLEVSVDESDFMNGVTATVSRGGGLQVAVLEGFNFETETGAVFDSNQSARVFLKDGADGDADGMVNGEIVFHGAPIKQPKFAPLDIESSGESVQVSLSVNGETRFILERSKDLNQFEILEEGQGGGNGERPTRTIPAEASEEFYRAWLGGPLVQQQVEEQLDQLFENVALAPSE